MKKLPRWAQPVDCEVAVVVTHMFEKFVADEKIPIDDDRAVIELVRDFCEIFQETHWSPDADYWDQRDFLEEIDKIMLDVRIALRREPDWINKEFRASYGKETLYDLLKRNFGE